MAVKASPPAAVASVAGATPAVFWSEPATYSIPPGKMSDRLTLWAVVWLAVTRIVNVTVSLAWAVVGVTDLSIVSFGSITVTGPDFAAGSSAWSVQVSLALFVSVLPATLLETLSTTALYCTVNPCNCRSGLVLTTSPRLNVSIWPLFVTTGVNAGFDVLDEPLTVMPESTTGVPTICTNAKPAGSVSTTTASGVVPSGTLIVSSKVASSPITACVFVLKESTIDVPTSVFVAVGTATATVVSSEMPLGGRKFGPPSVEP